VTLMAKITRAHHTGFTVKSLERSIAFYRDILGFELAFQWNPQAAYIGELVGYPEVDLHGAILRLPGTDVCLELLEYRNVEQVPVDMHNGNIGNGHIAFNVDNLLELYAELTRKGVKSVSPPVTPTIGPNKGGKAVYMIDPDGFRVELIESAQAFGSYKPE
jgi:catechol 2,3-dioxygenase-like lactoylglutathione lyase family enzyme